ncbi:MAG: P-loop NTPase [Butyricicoccus sp.]|nr:P-loop NTPase [Butyricicoccus sp.]
MEVILTASGKGGTGKTSFTAAVGAALAESGKKVLAVDGDCGLRNLDLALGMADRVVFSFADVILHDVALTRAVSMHPVYDRLYLLTAPPRFPELPEEGLSALAKQAEAAGFDYLLIDGPAGLPSELAAYAAIAHRGIVVTQPDAASIRGAETIARRLEEYGLAEDMLVVNRIRTRLIRFGFASNMDDAMDASGLPLLGMVPEDEDVLACAGSGKSIIASKKRGAARAYRNIARRLCGEYVPLMRLR